MAIQFDHTANGLVTLTTTNATNPVSYTLRLPDGTGTNGQFLQTDGTGNLSYGSASGSYAGLAGKPGVNVTITGNITGTGNVALLNADTNLLTISANIISTANLAFNSLYLTGNATVANLVGNVNYTNSVVGKPAANIELTGAVTGSANIILSYPTSQLSIATTYNTTTLDARYLMLSNPAVQSVTGPVGFYGNVLFYGNVTTMTANNLVVSDNFIYLNSTSVSSNPDFGIASNYNDGTYRHAGFFRDATDGIFKVFDQYTPEPDAAIDINTSHASFRLANFAANVITGNSLVLSGNATTGNVAITGTFNVTQNATLGANLVLPAQGNIIASANIKMFSNVYVNSNRLIVTSNASVAGSGPSYGPTGNDQAYSFVYSDKAAGSIVGSGGVGGTAYAQFVAHAGTPGGTTYNLFNTINGNGYALTTTNAAFEYQVGTYSTAYLALVTDSTERVRIDALGNVGVGTTTPTSKLHVVGNILSTGNVIATTFVDSDNQAYFLNPAGPVTAVNVLGNVTATTGNINARTGSVYAQAYYDADNATYYLDPAGPVTAVNVLGNVTATTGNLNARTGNVYSQGFYDADNIAYFLDPANTANALVVAGNAIVGRSVVTGSNFASNVGLNTSIIGGSTSVATGANSFVAGATSSTTLANYSSIIGGDRNYISSLSVSSDIFGATSGNISILGAGVGAGNSLIIGGVSNKITSNLSTILGGVFNTAAGNNSIILGGVNNSITTTGAGTDNAILSANGASITHPSATGTIIVGGQSHTVSGQAIYSAVVGGASHTISGPTYAFVGGGSGGTISASWSSYLAAQNGTLGALATLGGIYNGYGSTVNQYGGVVFGSWAISDAKGKFVISIPTAAEGSFYGTDTTTQGRTQIGRQILFSNTSPTYGNIFLNTDGYSTGAPERADTTNITKNNTIGPFRNNTVFTVKGIVNAANSTGTVKVWEFTTVAKRGASDSTLKFVGSYGTSNAIINTIAADPGTTNWAMSLYANTSTGVLTVVASTPGVTDNVRWMTSVETTEMAYA